MPSNSIVDAISFASVKHKDQKRKLTGEPYIAHPIEVGAYLQTMDLPISVVCAGYLHDTLEDTDATEQEISEKFGSEVLRIILSNTENKSLSWEERKKHTIDNVKNLDVGCFMLLLFDKFSNLYDMKKFYISYGETLWSKFNRGKEQQKWYYENLFNEFVQYVSAHKFNKTQRIMLPYILEQFRTSCIIIFNSDIPEFTKEDLFTSKQMTVWRSIQKVLRATCGIAVINLIISLVWIGVEYMILGYRNPNDVDTLMSIGLSCVIYYYRSLSK